LLPRRKPVASRLVYVPFLHVLQAFNANSFSQIGVFRLCLSPYHTRWALPVFVGGVVKNVVASKNRIGNQRSVGHKLALIRAVPRFIFKL